MIVPGFGVAGYEILSGATWATDGNGRGYNTPTLGSEVLLNGDFSAWTGDNPDWWSVLSEDANNYITEDANGARVVTDQSVNFQYRQTTAITANAWLQRTATLYSLTAGGYRRQYHSGTFYNDTASKTISLEQSRAPTLYSMIRATLGNCDYIVASMSQKEITTSTLFATLDGSTSDKTAGARIYSVEQGNMAGVVSLLDSSSNPQNGIVAYHDDENVYLDKIVAGAYTNLIETSSTFVQDAVIEIRRPSGNDFQLWYNGSQVGSDQTISDSGIIDNTLYGVFSTYSGNLFSRFTLDGKKVRFPS